MPAATQMIPSSSMNLSNGGRLVSADGRTLPLKGTSVRAEAQGGIARVVLEQRFMNPYDEPLRLRYLVPLPEDGAVSAYAFRLGARTIVGRVEPRQQARERFERAIVEGRTAALLDEERGSLFTQELGNVPPKAEIVCTLTIDQRLVWSDEGAWEWRFPTVVAPRYLGEPGRTPDAPRVVVDVADAPLAPTLTLSLRVGDALAAGVTSPSHAIASRADGTAQQISFVAERGAALDRDVVVRWPVACPRVGLGLTLGRPSAPHDGLGHAYGLVTIVPPSPEHAARALGRDLCVLLDTSGSMEGEPLDQARRVVHALVDTLGDDDQLEMIEFSNSPRHWKRSSVPATAAHRAAAHKWLDGLRASGSTDMTAGILEALATLRAEAQRQVVLVTDGQIGFEQEVLSQILAKLPKQSRLHTVGVGSAVNRSLTRPAAQAGGGVEVVIGLGEDPERASARIVKRTSRPIVTEVELSGSAVVQAATTCAADLFAGAPALLAVQLRAEGGELVVRGRTATGRYEERLTISPLGQGEGAAAMAALWARERVADRELRVAAGDDRQRLEVEIEALGVRFQIATRLTSFAAVSDTVDVDPAAATRQEVVPHNLPHGMSAGGLGLRAVPAPAMAYGRTRSMTMAGVVTQSGAIRGRALADLVAERADGAGDDFDEEQSALDEPMPRDVDELAANRPAAPPSRAISVGRAAPPAPPKKPAPMPKQEAAKKASSLLGRVRRFFTGARRLLGRKKRIAADLLSIEIALEAPLHWLPPARVVLRAADGSTYEAMPSLGATTREGEYGVGHSVRVIVQLGAAAPDPVGATLHLPDGSELEIELEDAR